MDDRFKAEALRVAADRLEKGGWKFTAEEIGEYAARIIIAFNREMKDSGK